MEKNKVKPESIKTRLKFTSENFKITDKGVMCQLDTELYIIVPNLYCEYGNAPRYAEINMNTVAKDPIISTFCLPRVTTFARPKGNDKFDEKIGKRVAMLKAQRKAYRMAYKVLMEQLQCEEICLKHNKEALDNLQKYIVDCSKDLTTCGYLRDIEK